MSIYKITESNLPTEYGTFKMHTYASSEKQPMPHIALVHEDTDFGESVLLRIHSECLTGDIFASKRCDCGAQLDTAMQKIGKEKGVLLYLRQEGRGIGLINKMKAYNAQDGGLDTHEANVHLGFEPDQRDYQIAMEIMEDLGVKSVRLLTNNPEKMKLFNESSITLAERIPLIIHSNEVNKGYLETKSKKFGHLLKP